MPRPPEVDAAWRWLARISLPMAALEDSGVIGRTLDACGSETRRVGGVRGVVPPSSARLLRSAEVRSARAEAFGNPLDGAKLDREWKAPDVEQAVDHRRVASPVQMRLLLDAIRSTGKSQGPRLEPLFGCMYYGMLRPSEAISLLLDECEPPAEGWGRLEFREVRSAAGREWASDDPSTVRAPSQSQTHA